MCVWPNEEDPRWCLGPLHICSLLKVSPIASTQCHQSPKFKPSCVSLSLTQSLCRQSFTLRVTSRFPIQTEKHFYCVSPCVVWCQTMKKVEAIYPPQMHVSRSAGLNVNQRMNCKLQWKPHRVKLEVREICFGCALAGHRQ